MVKRSLVIEGCTAGAISISGIVAGIRMGCWLAVKLHPDRNFYLQNQYGVARRTVYILQNKILSTPTKSRLLVLRTVILWIFISFDMQEACMPAIRYLMKLRLACNHRRSSNIPAAGGCVPAVGYCSKQHWQGLGFFK